MRTPSFRRLRPTCWLSCVLNLTVRLQLSSPGRLSIIILPRLLFPEGSAVTMNLRVELPVRTFSCTHHSVQSPRQPLGEMLRRHLFYEEMTLR